MVNYSLVRTLSIPVGSFILYFIGSYFNSKKIAILAGLIAVLVVIITLFQILSIFFLSESVIKEYGDLPIILLFSFSIMIIIGSMYSTEFSEEFNQDEDEPNNEPIELTWL